MKKLFILALGALTLAAVGCKSKVEKASDAALRHAELIKNGDYDSFVETFAFEPTKPAEAVTAEKEAYKRGLKERFHPLVQAKGGIKAVKVVSETVAPDKQTATVVINHEYNNGTNENASYDLVRSGDTWKMADAQGRAVWNTKDVDGTPITIKIKQEENRDVLKDIEDGEREFVKDKERGNVDVDKTLIDGEREVTKVREKKDGTTVTVEKKDGKRTVTREK